MASEKLIDRIIREAMNEGEFDDLEGTGKPVDLSSYFSAPEDLRAGHAVMKNAGVIPEEAQLLKEAQTLRLELNACENEEDRRRLRKSIDEKMLRYNLLRERQGRRQR
jgi:Domain of unknown function (DUF1992)